MRRKLIISNGDFSILDLYDGSDLIGVEIEGEFDVEEIDLDDYVRVSFIGEQYGATYCYRDPGLGLEVGDVVDVPTRYKDSNLATVAALGRGAWKKSTADVTARYVKER